jgi:hypothetical protein
MQRRVVLLVGLLLCVPAMLMASTVTVSPGPNPISAAAGQVVTVGISGGESIDGVQLDVELQAGLISALDLVGAGTVFAGATQGDSVAFPTIHQNSGTAVNSAAPKVGTGLEARITIDATGLLAGTYFIHIDGALDGGGGPSDVFSGAAFDSLSPTLINGVFTIAGIPTPEPSSIVLGLFAAAGLGMVMIRKHRARRAA